MPKIYHIVHVDRLPSIVAHDGLLSDAEMQGRAGTGTVIGMSNIKRRRLYELMLASHPGLFVGECVPFYFCPRSVMLFLIERRNSELTYQGGQEPIVHLESDLDATVAWATEANRRWAFTLSNAGAYYFEDRCELAQINEINWAAVHARQWAGAGISPKVQEGKQAEFLVEGFFPWHLIERIGAHSAGVAREVSRAVQAAVHKPAIETRTDWYY